MLLTGAEIVVECLKEQGVDTVFGYPGGAILNVYDALYKHSDEIRHVLTSHEQGASHAADGYARTTGKVGVCLATSGREQPISLQALQRLIWTQFQWWQSPVMSMSIFLAKIVFRKSISPVLQCR